MSRNTMIVRPGDIYSNTTFPVSVGGQDLFVYKRRVYYNENGQRGAEVEDSALIKSALFEQQYSTPEAISQTLPEPRRGNSESTANTVVFSGQKYFIHDGKAYEDRDHIKQVTGATGNWILMAWDREHTDQSRPSVNPKNRAA